MKPHKLILNGIVSLSSAVMVFADPASPDKAAKAEEPAIVTEAEIKLPGVTVNRETLEVRIEATVCLDSGVLEFVVCKPDSFEHESIFTTDAKPELVHAALLLAGLKPTPQLAGLTDLWWDKAMKQEASRVKIEVEWKAAEAQKRVNLSSMVRGREGADGVVVEAQDAWVFAGSFLQTNEDTGERFYAANFSGILVGIWPEPSTVIQYGVASGNPYENKGFGMEINEKNVPKVGTKVNLVFSRYIPPQEEPAGERLEKK